MGSKANLDPAGSYCVNNNDTVRFVFIFFFIKFLSELSSL